MKLVLNKYRILLVLAIAIFAGGCKVSYKMTGANIHPDVKTLSVQFFENRAPIVNPTLSTDFTEALKDKFVSQTSLDMVNGTGHLDFEGTITGYSTKPVSIQSNEAAALNRLTVSVKVKFTNEKEPKWSFDTSFSAYEDYDSSKSLDSVEEELLEQIIEKLTEDIFNKSVANW